MSRSGDRKVESPVAGESNSNEADARVPVQWTDAEVEGTFTKLW